MATLTRAVRAASDRGAAIVVVDHDFDLVLRIADRVAVLHRGAVLAVGHPDDIRRNDAVIAAYVGDST